MQKFCRDNWSPQAYLEIAEKEVMGGKMNSYGKTWHVCPTDQGQKLPLGEPVLAWSFNRDGEAKAGLVERETRICA